MDRSTEWPWSWDAEAEWKADLEERDYERIEELIDSAFEDETTGSNSVPGSPRKEETTEDTAPEKYLVTT